MVRERGGEEERPAAHRGKLSDSLGLWLRARQSATGGKIKREKGWRERIGGERERKVRGKFSHMVQEEKKGRKLTVPGLFFSSSSSPSNTSLTPPPPAIHRLGPYPQ